MLIMAQKQYIKYLWESKEKSLREIARITEHSFQTVQKYAYMEDWNEDNLPNIEPQRYPILGEYIPIINEWMENDKRIPRKQRHTAHRIYERLRDEYGYKGKYSSVKKYVRKKRYIMNEVSEGYLPLEQPKCHAQIDFGEFVYYDANGVQKEAHALTISFPYSNKAYTQVFPSENQECLLEGMKRIFEYIGGVPEKIKADNMTTAVAQVLEGHERVLSEGFSRFMLHYRFEAEFCNPASGNEKGNVENKVGYTRRNFFVPVPIIENFDTYNKKLWEICEKDGEREHYKHHVKINELWEEEKKELLYLPEYDYSVFRYEVLRVNKYGMVSVDTNKYSVTPELAGGQVQAKIFSDKVEFYHEKSLISTYKRSYEKDKEFYDWTQYLNTLCRKPGAVEHTRFFGQMPKLWQEQLRLSHGKERKNALELLLEIVGDGNRELCEESITLATECGRTDADSIRQCYYLIAKKEYHPKPLELTGAVILDYNPNLSAYDSLMRGGEDR